MEFQSKQVIVGDDPITIGRFRGLKAIEAAAVVADIVQNVPEVTDKVNAFVKQFEANNSVTLTPAMVRLPRYRDIGLEPEDVANEPGGTLTIPQPPTVQQQLIHVTPDLFRLARRQLTRLIGVVAIPNPELETADDNDNVEQATFDYGRMLIRRAYVDQLAELLVAAWQSIADQFESREDLREQLGELPLLGTLLSMDQNRGSKSSPASVPQEAQDKPPTSKTAKRASQSSSTGSRRRTGGTDEPLSTASRGSNSSD